MARGDLNQLLRESLVIIEHQQREKNVTESRPVRKPASVNSMP